MNHEVSEELLAQLRSPFDPVLSEPLRLKIQAALAGLPAEGALRFTELGRILGMSDGNLGAHLSVLVERGYVDADVTYRGKRRTTWYRATATGRDAFAAHVRSLRTVIEAGERHRDA